MADRIVLAWTVDTAGSVFGSAAAATALAAVPLYFNATTDPILGQLFGLTVVSDATSQPTASTAKRTLTLNMTSTLGGPKTPPPFPCNPRTATPPVLPYPFRTPRLLPASCFVTNGSTTVQTTASLEPSLNINDVVQFSSQKGVFYTVTAVGSTSISINPAFSGTTGNTPAFRDVPTPATKVALYSSSPLDTNGAATTPTIAAGPGARTVSITYMDSLGAGPFTVTTSLTGKRPAQVTLDGGSVDIAIVTAMFIASSGAFGNSVGQITLAEMSEDVPTIHASSTPEDFPALTDVAQLLISRHLVYLPPSYFAVAGQQNSFPQLTGDFIVTTGSTNVRTTEDQTGALAAGQTIQFASQLDKVYTIAAVTAKIVTLDEAYSGLDLRKYDSVEEKFKAGPVIDQATGAFRITSSPAIPPPNRELAGPLAQFLEVQTAAPPPNPPLNPASVPDPTFLSGFFSRTLSLALAVPVTPSTITFV